MTIFYYKYKQNKKKLPEIIINEYQKEENFYLDNIFSEFFMTYDPGNYDSENNENQSFHINTTKHTKSKKDFIVYLLISWYIMFYS